MLTAKGKYSLKALAHLAALDPETTTQAMDIAAAKNIPKKLLDTILGELRNAGIVYSRKGPRGGYRLARAPGEMKVGQVIRTIDGPLAPIACASRTAYRPCADCVDVKACPVRLVMNKVRDAIADVLDRLTIADMVAMGEGGNAALNARVRQKQQPLGRGRSSGGDHAPPQKGAQPRTNKKPSRRVRTEAQSERPHRGAAAAARRSTRASRT
jgi:Rrf2 family protein